MAILDVGAYGKSMASQYNARPIPQMVMTYKGSCYIVRKRERGKKSFGMMSSQAF